MFHDPTFLEILLHEVLFPIRSRLRSSINFFSSAKAPALISFSRRNAANYTRRWLRYGIPTRHTFPIHEKENGTRYCTSGTLSYIVPSCSAGCSRRNYVVHLVINHGQDKRIYQSPRGVRLAFTCSIALVRDRVCHTLDRTGYNL